MDRELIFRTLTFWLRPAFVLRVLNRFQVISGFDRSVALASSALTALIPLAIVIGAILPHHQADAAARWIIDRYGLTGAGAAAVRDVFTSGAGSVTDIGLLGLFFLAIAVLSFARGMQRLVEQTWELKPLSVRNTVGDLVWLVGLAVYLGLSGLLHRVFDHGRITIASNVVIMPLSAAFILWTGSILSARRIPLKDLLPFAILASLALAIYFTGAVVYLPHQFSAYANRYGVIGVVFAMISSLFCVMVVLTASAAVGREVRAELGRISRGERPSDDEVKREWDAIIAETRSRWESVREHFERRRGKDER